MIPGEFADDPDALLKRATPKLQALGADISEGAGPTHGLLLGPTGCGKTSTAAALALRWLSFNGYGLLPIDPGGPGYSVEGGHYERPPKVPKYLAWVDAYELAMSERRYKLGTEEPLLIRAASGAMWTIIDDVGLERDTSALMLVLQRRYANGRPTLLTSGRTPAELAEFMGAAMVRRVMTCKGVGGALVNCHE